MSSTHDTMSRPTSSGIASPPRQMRSRTQSISSDRPSIIAHSLMSPPLSISPEAAFIAASAASQIVTNDHDSHADTWYDQHGIEPAGETALVAPAALQLVNSFLDQLLFNFLHVSRDTTLNSLRPAVSEVLKPKLAKDAINQADEELREYLGGGDEDDFVQPHGADPSRDWDLELVWKRTRLRCMVYSSLGDMEEEDEDYYMEQEDLELGADEQGTEVISPAVAIFLTSILEFMGEQALVVAGQGAYHRMRVKLEKELKEGSRGPAEIADRIVVEELDMERVALDRTLGRLWRAWKKRIRSPTLEGSSRPFSQGSMRGSHFRQHSTVSMAEHPLPTMKPSENEEEKAEEKPAEEEVDEETLAASIPLPLGDRDVDEIEVPGLVSYSDDEDDETEDDEDELPERPKSLMVIPMTMRPHVADSEDEMEMTMEMPDSPILPPRKRSNSLPTLSIYVPKRQKLEPEPEPEPETEEGGGVEREDDGNDEDMEEAEAEKEDEEETPRKSRKSLRVSKINTQAEPEGSGDEGDEDVGDFEILTSSRVSIAGNSPVISESAKMPSRSNSGRPASVHSARLIEVANPKSPILRSRTPSIDRADPTRQSSLSRASSVSTAPIAEEQRKPEPADAILRAATTKAAAAARSPIEKTARSVKSQADQAISEVEEDVEALSARAESTPTTATISTPTSATMPPEALSSQIKNSQGIFGSVVRGHVPSSPRSPGSPPQSPREEAEPTSTKVTILSTSNSTGPFVEMDRPPQVPHKSPGHGRNQPPQIRDRTSSKSANGNTSPTSIGLVSVERAGDHDVAPLAPSSIAPRQIHTSGSSGSTGTNRLKPVRTSEESGGNRGDVARNFEELIQSDQTIQYTLTPENMRDIESSRSVHNSSPVMNKARKSEDARTLNADRSRSSSNAESQLKRTTSVSRATGLNSHPVAVAATSPPPPPPPPATRPAVTTKLSGPIPRAPASAGGNRTRVTSYQARDARIPRESMVDIADFIRNTGPPGDNSPAPLRNVTGPMASGKNSLDSRRISSASNRPRLQARDAAIDSKVDNSDLIDFIRRGPPSGTDNPRIPRTVAPFRSTMDSDQMSGAVGGKAVDASLPNIRYSQASTNVTTESVAAPSMRSINSQSALLRNKPSYQSATTYDDDESMMPRRKTRRVKDPYAIDFSDEEDDDMYGRPAPKPAAKEESLADFLKNYNPPSEAANHVAFDIPPSKPKKKSSAPSLMGRFTRTNTNGSNHSNGTHPPSVSASNGAAGGRGYIPIQVNMPPGYDKYGPIDGPAAVPKPSSGHVPMKKFEPRDPVPSASRTGTSDLADFLRNSGPPPSMAPQYSPSTEDDGAGFSKMFGRRKKSTFA